MIKKLMLVLLGTLCFTTGCSTNPQEEKTKVVLNEVTHSVFYAPQYIAIEKGFFEEEGIEIELVNGGGADKVMAAVLANQCDIGLAGPESCIYVYNQGKKDYPVVIGQLTKRDGSFLFGRDKEDFKWKNLKGKTIIGGRSGGVPEMTLEYIMKKNGVIPQKDAKVDTSVQFNMMAGAFLAGQGDYVTLFEPTATQMEQEGEGHIMCSIGQESGEIPYTAYFVSPNYIKEHKETVQGFINAIAKAQKWMNEADNSEMAELLSHQFPDTNAEILEKVVKRYREIDAWNSDPVMKSSSLERLEDVMVEAGVLKETERVDFSDLVDNSYAENASN